MRRLMLLRHARTEGSAPSGHDFDRRLDPRGVSDATELGAWLAQQGHIPDLALVSNAVRAQQTWDLMAPAMPKVRAERLAELYGADVGELMQAIHAAETFDPPTLMLVGHNPGLHELALALAGSGDAAAQAELGDNLPTSGLAVLDFDTDDWNGVTFRTGRLALFVSPKLLKHSAG